MNFTKHKITSLFIALFLLSNTGIIAQQWVDIMQDTSASLQHKSQVFESYWSNKSMEKGKGFKQFKRIEYFLQNRIDNSGRFNQETDIISDYQKANQQAANQKSLGTAGKWVHLGPFGPTNGGGSGRINCISFHPTNANIILVEHHQVEFGEAPMQEVHGLQILMILLPLVFLILLLHLVMEI